MSELRKELGRICRANFGIGGYNEAMFGLDLMFEGSNGGWGVGTFVSGGWAYGLIDVGPHTKWTEEDRTRTMAEMCKKVTETLQAAKVSDISKLVGKPVEITFDGMMLKDWRILTEVL